MSPSCLPSLSYARKEGWQGGGSNVPAYLPRWLLELWGWLEGRLEGSRYTPLRFLASWLSVTPTYIPGLSVTPALFALHT